MKNRIINGVLVTSLLTGGATPVCTLTAPVVLAADTQELDLSQALSKLGAQYTLVQMTVDPALSRPNVEMADVPALQVDQRDIKADMEEWSDAWADELLASNSKSNKFTIECDTYYDSTFQEFLDNGENKQDVLNRVDKLQSLVKESKKTIQTHMRDLQDFSDKQVAGHKTELDRHVEDALKVLSAAGSGKIDKNEKAIVEAKNAIQKDLQELALIPGALSAKGLDIFKDLYSLSKGMIDPAFQSAAEAWNKGLAIEKQIEKAADQAEREKLKKEYAKELAAAAAAKLQTFDLVKAIDVKTITDLGNSFDKVNKLKADQIKNLKDLVEKNENLYSLTEQVKVDGVQKFNLLNLKSDTNAFTSQIKRELDLLTLYQKDWDQIEACLKQISTAVEKSEDVEKQLDRLVELNEQLKEQVKQFKEATL